MQELSTNKKMRIIKLYLAGFSYEEIAKKVGVSKGTVSNVIAALKAGQFPEVSTIPEEISSRRSWFTANPFWNTCGMRRRRPRWKPWSRPEDSTACIRARRPGNRSVSSIPA